MKHKRLILCSLLLLMLSSTGAQAQTMYVTEKSGTQTAYALSSLRTITFTGANAIVQKTDNSTGLYALSALRYLNFTGITTVVSKPTIQLSTAKLITYPNPVTDLLNIDLTGVTGAGAISILTFEGKVIKTQNTSGNCFVTFSIGHLSKGMYLCRYSSADEIITVKIVKQ